MYRFNVPVPPDDDFPEVVVAQRMGEDFKEEYVEYAPRWRFDKSRRVVVADEKFFYAMADTAERLQVENVELRELVRDMFGGYRGAVEMLPSGPSKNVAERAVMHISERMRELGGGGIA